MDNAMHQNTSGSLYRKILVPIDGTPCSENAACTAFALARRLGAAVILTHVVAEPYWRSGRRPEVQAGREACARALLERWVRAGEVGWEIAVDSRLARGVDVASAIVEVAEEEGCDLILTGTHGHRGVERLLLGSVAERVARLATVPVLLARRRDDEPRWNVLHEQDHEQDHAGKGEVHV